jgi:hypothetical protein
LPKLRVSYSPPAAPVQVFKRFHQSVSKRFYQPPLSFSQLGGESTQLFFPSPNAVTGVEYDYSRFPLDFSCA